MATPNNLSSNSSGGVPGSPQANASITAETLALTELWECAHHVNSLVCIAGAVPLNTLAIWLIVRHSPDELRIYRKVLLQVAILDLLFAVINFLVEPVSGRHRTAN